MRTCIDKHSFDLRILTDQESRITEGTHTRIILEKTHTRIILEKTRKIQRACRAQVWVGKLI